MNYSLLKSRTFWALVIASIVAVVQVVAPVVAPDYGAAIISFLNGLAILFHLDAVKTAQITATIEAQG